MEMVLKIQITSGIDSFFTAFDSCRYFSSLYVLPFVHLLHEFIILRTSGKRRYTAVEMFIYRRHLSKSKSLKSLH